MNRSTLFLSGLLFAILAAPVRSAVVVFDEYHHGLLDTGGVLVGDPIVSAAAGANHLLLLGADGRVFAEGASTRGQLGNGVSGEGQGVVAVKPGSELGHRPFVAIATGFDDSFALTDDGRVFAWGLNHDGQLGGGNTNELVFQPQMVATNGVLKGKKVTAIAAGSLHCLALTIDGRVYAWGNNDSGQLGDGTTNGSRVPVAVEAGGVLAGKVVTAISAGSAFSLALTSDGQVFGWGYNEGGALGDGTLTNRLVPVAVDLTGAPAGAPVTAVSAGANFGLALTAFGRVLAWGDNDQGQLGDGTRDARPKPALVDFGTLVTNSLILHIATGSGHSLALTGDGTALGWGDNQNVQLGGGINEDHLTPTRLPATGALAGVTITGVFSASSSQTAIFVTAGPVQTAIRLIPAGAELSIMGEPCTFYGLLRSGSLDPRIPSRGSGLFITDVTGYAVHTNADLAAPSFWRAVPVPLNQLYRAPTTVPPVPQR